MTCRARIHHRIWAPALKGEQRVDWWWDTGTASFMQAIMAYGHALAEAGQPDQAALCYQALLAMEPRDTLGAGAELEELGGPGTGPRR